MPIYMQPLTFKQANAFIFEHHRHHPPSRGCKFVLGVSNDGGDLIGVAIVGRTTARLADDGGTIEVTRVCTDGTKNVCSMLYSSAARIARLMGFNRIITYILASEPGVSLKASGWSFSHTTRGGTWDRPSRGRIDSAPTAPKHCYVKQLK